MKKLLLSFLMVFMVPVIASAAPEKVMEVTFGSAGNVEPKKGNSSYTETIVYTGTGEIDGKTWTVVNFNNNNKQWPDFIKCGTNKGAATGSVTSDFAFSDKISQVEVSIAVNYNNVTSIDLYSSTDGKNWDKVDSNTSIATTTTTASLNLKNPSANLYYKVEFVCTKASKNGVVSLKSITYYKEEETNPDLLPANLSFGEKTAFTIGLGEEFTEAPTLVNPYNLPVTYTSSTEEVAMVDESTGDVVLMGGVGTTTISAAFEGNDTYNAQTVSYNLTVIDPTLVTVLKSALTTQTDFNTLTFEGENADKVWTFGGTAYGLKGTIYQLNITTTGAYAVLPIIDATSVKNLNLTFDCAANFFTDAANFTKDCSVWVREEGGEWSQVEMETTCTGSSWTFVPATASLESMIGKKFQIGFRYKKESTVTGTWEIKNVVVTGNKILAPELLINGKPVSGENPNYDDGKLSFGDVPDGIAVYYRIESNNAPSGDEPANAPAKAAPATMENDGKIFNLYTAPETLGNGSHKVSYFAYDEATGLKSEVKTINVSNTTGIEGVAAEDGEAVWYNLQGVRVAEPQQGIYVRVANGKAAKVVVE